MPDKRRDTEPSVAEDVFRELVVSARVYYRNDKRVDFAEWQHLVNEAKELGLTERDALLAARRATGDESWSPPLPPPDSSERAAAFSMRSGSDSNSLEAISLGTSDGALNVRRLREGTVINGSYRLEQEIGSGG
ncbi:MAG: hypothetical protein ACOC1F_10990, partial [Myxococcota bacterium]